MLALSALTLADTHVGLNPSRLWPDPGALTRARRPHQVRRRTSRVDVTGISDGGADESTLSSLFFAFAALGLQPPKFARC